MRRRLMIEQELLRVDQCPDDVFVTLLFAKFWIVFAILVLRRFAQVIQGQFQLFRIGFSRVNRVVQFTNFLVVLPLRIVGQQGSAALGIGQLVLHVFRVQQVQALRQAGVLRPLTFT